MKLLLLLTFVLLTSCACQPIKDPGVAPASLNQRRTIIDVNGVKEVGINGFINKDSTVKLSLPKDGTISIRGLSNCGFYSESSSNPTNMIMIDALDLPDEDFCLYSLHSRINAFDAPSIGMLIVRNFNNPNIVPLKVKMNNVQRVGVNWTQIMEMPIVSRIGINESLKVSLYPTGTTGKLVITGCNIEPIKEFYDQDNINTIMNFSIDRLYSKAIDKDCVFHITANNDDYLMESASVFVSVYKPIGSFLPRPLVTQDSKRICFEFFDKYVVGIIVNDKYIVENNNKICVPFQSKYEIQAATAKMRTFFGVFENNVWTMEK